MVGAGDDVLCIRITSVTGIDLYSCRAHKTTLPTLSLPFPFFPAGAHYALALFFLGNFASNEETSRTDDEATVLRVLSVSNYDPLVPTYVQLAKHEDRAMLESCDIDVLLCHDEFRTAMQARNR